MQILLAILVFVYFFGILICVNEAGWKCIFWPIVLVLYIILAIIAFLLRILTN